MMLNNNNGLYQNLLLKYLQLEKKISSIKNQIQEKSQINSNYKTELCKNYQAKGFCPYGRKCKFAHGEIELITKIQEVNYKKEKCKSFYKRGYCPYGLAQVGNDRLEEYADPEKAIARGAEYYRAKGYTEGWINQRLQTIEMRKELTDEWKARGIEK